MKGLVPGCLDRAKGENASIFLPHHANEVRERGLLIPELWEEAFKPLISIQALAQESNTQKTRPQKGRKLSFQIRENPSAAGHKQSRFGSC